MILVALGTESLDELESLGCARCSSEIPNRNGSARPRNRVKGI